jgi:hypothetical protein
LLTTAVSDWVDEVNMCTYAIFTAERQIVIVAITSNWAMSLYRRPQFGRLDRRKGGLSER